MISKSIKIGDKEVNLTCSAGTLIRYRDNFESDCMMDMKQLGGEEPNTDVLSKLAYTMAKQASTEELPEFIDWLDQFELVDFMKALGEISELWNKNTQTSAEAKKK